MIDQLPYPLETGKHARLFPSLKPSNKEQQATSIILAAFKLVPEFLPELIKTTAVTISNRTDFRTYTEVTLKKKNPETNDRPDGFIYIKNRNEWTALVETKVGSNTLNQEQFDRYLEDAYANNIDALITISKEFTQGVEHPPPQLRIPHKKYMKKVKLYHLSWRRILSTAQMLRLEEKIGDQKKTFILNELLLFLRDDTVGNKSFSQMPSAWPDICEEISNNNILKASDKRLPEISGAFVEEFSEIAWILTDLLGVYCKVGISRKMLKDRSLWQKSIEGDISSGKPIKSAYHIPDAAGKLMIEIDIKSSKFLIGMEIDAPKDKKIKGQVSWLQRQIKNAKETKNVFVKIRWNSRADDLTIDINQLSKEEIERYRPSTSSAILSFTLLVKVEDNRIFRSRKKFISELEENVERFYEDYVQYLKKWVPRAPKPIEQYEDTSLSE